MCAANFYIHGCSILFERLVALRPHPWGLLTTFIDLIKDDQYGFWGLEFTRCAPEIERSFAVIAFGIFCFVKLLLN
jgi:hypothetical protein